MKLTWHIFLKDLRRMRGLLGIWVLLLGGEVLLHGWMLAADDPHLFWRMNMLGVVGGACNVGVAYFLVAMLVREDPLIGTGMFWATRPISGGRLLGAKAMGIALLFGVLPLAVRLPWWLWCGFGPAEIGTMAGFGVLVWLAVAVPAAALAALSDSGGRMLLLSLVLGAALQTLAVTSAGHHLHTDADLVQGRVVAAAAAAGAGAVAAVIWQYLRRQARVAGAILLVGAAAGVWGLFQWPWALGAMLPVKAEPLAGTEEVAVSAGPVSLPANWNPQEAVETTLRVDFRIDRLPADLAVTGGTAEVDLVWPNGDRTTYRGARVRHWGGETRSIRHVLGLGEPRPDPETLAQWERVVATRPHSEVVTSLGNPLHDTRASANTPYVLLRLPGAAARRIMAERPACEAKVRLVFSRPEVLLEMPLRAGESAAGLGIRLRVVQGEEEQGGRDAITGLRRRTLLLGTTCATPPTVEPMLFRVDRSWGRIAESRSNAVFLPTVARVGSAFTRANAPALWRDGKWVDDAGWPGRLTLAAVRYRELGHRDFEVRVDRLAPRRQD